MPPKKAYGRTLLACYLGFVSQAICANFAPLLYVTFHRTYGLGLSQLALISTAFFLLQLVTDLLCGFSVGIMWPGSISISSRAMPRGGTAMFALLALAGDLGGSVGPSLVGNVSQHFGNDLRTGVLAGVVFPVVLVVCALAVRKGSSPLGQGGECA